MVLNCEYEGISGETLTLADRCSVTLGPLLRADRRGRAAHLDGVHDDLRRRRPPPLLRYLVPGQRLQDKPSKAAVEGGAGSGRHEHAQGGVPVPAAGGASTSTIARRILRVRRA